MPITSTSKLLLKHQLMTFLIAGILASAAILHGSSANAAEPAVVPPASTNIPAGSTAGLPRIIILATGGTIAGQADPRAANAYNAGGLGAQQLIQAVPGIDRLARLSTEQVASIGSQDMNDKVWLQLARRIQQISDRNEADAIVITHGTDTIEETAFFLDNVLHINKPVVVVGSMRPSTAISADGPANLYEAVEVAATRQARGRGVMIVMDDRIESARWATKTNTTSVETIRSPDTGPIGYVDPASVRFVADRPVQRARAFPLPAGDTLPRVEIVYGHSNMDALQIDHAISDKARGIVLAGVGDGNTSKQALDALVRAAHEGIIVIRSTHVGSGFVNRNVEVDDDRNGFVASLDLNPQKARILAQLLIVNGITSPAAVQQAFVATQ